jgi:uncharacterized protein (TIGR02246 family)
VIRHRFAPRVAALAALAAFGLPCAACAHPQPGADPAVPRAAAEIRAVLDSTAAGWNRGDLDRYLWAYADSTTTMGAHGPERGRAAVETQMRQGFWRTGRPAQTLRYEHVDVRPLGPASALVTGEYVLSGGGRPDRTGWFTTVWARTRDGWRMIHDHS